MQVFVRAYFLEASSWCKPLCKGRKVKLHINLLRLITINFINFVIFITFFVVVHPKMNANYLRCHHLAESLGNVQARNFKPRLWLIDCRKRERSEQICEAQASTEVTTHKSRLRYIHNSCFTFAMWNAHIIKVHFNVNSVFGRNRKKKAFWTLVTFHPAAKLISGWDRAGMQKKSAPDRWTHSLSFRWKSAMKWQWQVMWDKKLLIKKFSWKLIERRCDFI